MERFDELTDEEVLALTPEEVERYKDYECAMEGAPLLPKEPGPKPEKPETHKDVTVYKVGSFLFGSQDDASRLVELLGTVERYETEYVPGPGYNHVAVRAHELPAVSTEQHYSRAGWERDREAVTAYEREEKEWAAARDEYKKLASRRGDVTEWIDERIGALREREQYRARLTEKLERYRDLAGGDENTARRFLINAHPDAAELFPLVDVAAEPETEEAATA